MTTPPASGSWTLNFYRKWRPFLTIPSIIRLRQRALRDNENTLTTEGTIRLRVRRPFHTELKLREFGTDLFTLEEILMEGVYNRISDLIPYCKTIVDLGANIGLASLFFASRYPGSRIVSVEPHPDNFALLSANVGKLAGSGRCFPLHAAVWSRSGQTLGMATPVPGAYCGVRVSENGASGGPAASSVTMPEILERYGISKVDLLKVDIEGAEVELFSGDVSWLERISAIAIEFHGDSRSRSGFDGIVQRFGFKVIDSSPHTVLLIR